MDDALFNYLGKDHIKAFSTGSQLLGRLNAGVIALLQWHGIFAERFPGKFRDAFENKPIDSVITVCNKEAGEI